MRALLDGDIYAFRAAASSENEHLGIAIARVEEMIDNTLLETGASEMSLYLTGSGNFRYEVYPEYKAHRKEEKPRHLADLRKYLIDKYQAAVSEGCEADDLLGIEQCASEGTIICSLDKDLRMIPGQHYSFAIRGPNWERPAEFANVGEFAGLKHFYTQMLVGDPADNIKGAAGIGKVKAARILADCTDEKELFEAVEPFFSSEEELLMTGRCLWIWREEGDDWKNRYKDLQRLLGREEPN